MSDLNQKEEELDCYNNILKINPNNVNALYYKGILLQIYQKVFQS